MANQFAKDQAQHRKNMLIEQALNAGIIPLANDKQKDANLFRRLRKLPMDDLRDNLNRWEKAASKQRQNLPEIGIVSEG